MTNCCLKFGQDSKEKFQLKFKYLIIRRQISTTSTLLFFSLLISSCGNQDSNQVKAKEDIEEINTKSTIKINKDTIVSNLITNRNVEERLTEYGIENKETIVLIKSDKGDIKVKLYRDTPLHRASFLLMAKNSCFDGIVFTRVSKGFMAQAGGTYDEETVNKRNHIGKYTIPAEILPHHYHKKGALAAARSYNNNPDKRSSPFNFYFVEGSIYSNATLDKYEELNDYTFPKIHRNYYLNNPGAAHIDGEHTVFGEVIEGYEIIPEITKVKKSSSDWPITDIFITSVKVIE